MKLVPLTQREAKAAIAKMHRHLSPPRGDVIRVGLEVDGELVGVAVAGRPTARMLQDGRTLEVLRVATDMTPNACSRLYGSLRRAAKALGWGRLVTYTRDDEPGSSLQASGWTFDGYSAGGEWSRPSRERRAAEQPIRKKRWVIEL